MNLCAAHNLARFGKRKRSRERQNSHSRQQSNNNFHLVPPACKIAGVLLNVEQHGGEASSCSAGARTRRKLRRSTGGWEELHPSREYLKIGPSTSTFYTHVLRLIRRQFARLLLACLTL